MPKRKIHVDDDSEGGSTTKKNKQKSEEIAANDSATEVNESQDKPVEVPDDSAGTKDITVQALEDRCKAAEERAEAEHDAYLRTLAEYSNFRRRMFDELDQARKFGTEDLIIRLLPLIDSFERGIQSANVSRDFDTFYDGILLILRQLFDILEKEGLKPIETENLMFDPNFHEAVMREENEELPEGTILEELRKGYTLGDKVIRPSMVKVSIKPE